MPSIEVPVAEQQASEDSEKSDSRPSPSRSPDVAASTKLPTPAPPMLDPPPAEQPIEPAVDQSAPTFRATQPSVARRFKSKRRRKNSGMLIPITFGSILVASIAYFYMQQSPELTGELTADNVAFPDLAPGMVDRATASASAETIDLVVDTLTDSPERFDTGLVEMQFRGTPQGIEVTISPATQTLFFRVNIKRDAELMDYYTDHGRELSDYQQEKLKEAATDFFTTWAESIQESDPIDRDRMLEYRDRLGFNVLVNGLGFHVVAIVGKTSYRCAYEGDGHLYFLLPKDTKRFKITGRKLENGTILFPGNYTVKVSER